MTTIIVLISILLVIMLLVSGRNRFIELEEEIKNAESKVLLTKNKYIEAQKAALGLAGKATNNEGAIYERIASSDRITTQDLMALGQAYPDLKDKFTSASQMIERLMRDYTGAQEELNELVATYNKRVSMFPSSITAYVFKREKQELIGEAQLSTSRQLNVSDGLDYSQYL